MGIFDIDIGFDDSLLNFAGAIFGDPVLGDQLDLFGFGSITGIDNSIPGLVKLFELSLDLPSDLDSLQSGSFILATLTFDTLAVGTANFELPYIELGDSFGDPLSVDSISLSDVTVLPSPTTPVPEPTVFLLLLMGLITLTFNKVAFKKILTALLLLVSFSSVQASASYVLKTVAKTGQSPGEGGVLTGINTVSINDRGNIAFLGYTANGGSIFMGDVSGKPVQISFSTPKTSRIYSPGIQINNTNQVIATDRLGSTRLVRVWEGNTPGVATVIARGNISGGTAKFPAAFDSVYGYPTLSNSPNKDINPFVAFSALHTVLDTVLATPLVFGETAKSNFNKGPLDTPLRPSIADNGQIVVREDPIGAIRVYEHDLSTFQDIATSAEFSVLGRASGISDDGRIVVFYGKRHSGEEGIFICLTNNLKTIIQIAGVSGNGIVEPGETFVDFNGNNQFDKNIETDIGPFSGFVANDKVAVAITINNTNYHIRTVYKAILRCN